MKFLSMDYWNNLLSSLKFNMFHGLALVNIGIYLGSSYEWTGSLLLGLLFLIIGTYFS